MKKFITTNTAGILLCLAIALVAKLLARNIPIGGAVSTAILLGMLVNNVYRLPPLVQGGIKFSESRLLAFAIACLGVMLQFQILLQLGPTVLLLSVSVITFTLLLSRWMGKKLGFSSDFSLLMGCGNAICGSSAIAAVAPVLKSNDQEIGFSVGIVNFLGTIGMFLYPWFAGYLHFKNVESGMLLGGTLQSIGQVVGAGFALNPEVGQFSTLVKMSRILMLGPVIVALILIQARDRAPGKRTGGILGVPRFIIGFFLLALLSSLEILPSFLVEWIKQSGEFLLLIAMSAIGLKINLKGFLSFGSKGLLLGGITALFQLSFVVGVIYLLR